VNNSVINHWQKILSVISGSLPQDETGMTKIKIGIILVSFFRIFPLITCNVVLSAVLFTAIIIEKTQESTFMNQANPNKSDLLLQELRDDILCGNLSHGDRLLPERELAAQYRVSRTTVRCTLERMQTLGLISRRKGSGTYISRPKNAVQKKRIALLTPLSNKSDLESGYINQVLLATHQSAQNADYTFELITSCENQYFQLVLARQGFDPGDFDGYIFLYPLRQAEIDFLTARQIKFVSLEHPECDAEISSVHVDDYSGAEQATRMLLQAGCRRPMFLNGTAQYVINRNKEEGFIHALAEADIVFAPAMTREIVPNDEKSGIRAIESLLAEKIKFDGLLVYGDWATWGAVTTLRQHGIMVPEQMPLVMYDDFPWVSRVLGFTVTSIRQPFSGLIKAAVKILIRKIEQNTERNIIQLLAPQIIPGNSCKNHQI